MSDAAGRGTNALGWPPAEGLPALPPGAAVHLVGVAGAGMSGLARVMAERGLRVSGSDRSESPQLRALEAWGVAVHVGHAADHLPPACRLVVRSPAVPDDNPELSAARRSDVPITKRAVLLGALLDGALGVAVGGTHGKTTTSGLVAFLAVEAGLDPTFFVGGDLPDLGTNARAGTGAHVVAEADEYDRTFLHGHPWLAVITGVELDHPDIYPDLDAVVEAFRAFAGLVRPDGRVLVQAADPNAVEAAADAAAELETYAVLPTPTGAEPDWAATALDTDAGLQRFEVRHAGTSHGVFATALAGRHNVANCLAAVAAAVTMGIEADLIRGSLPRYRGPARRFEILGRAGGVTVIDDYAHHPTEIAATLAGARDRYPAARLWAVVQPHTFSRVRAMGEAFGAAMATADRSVVLPVYAAREAPIEGADAASVAAALPDAATPSDLDEAAALCAAESRPGDVLLFMGAGDVTAASRRCLAEVARRATDELAREARGRGLGGDVTHGGAVGPYTSLRVGGPADLVVRVTEANSLAAWWRLAVDRDVPVRVLGRGTNVLVRDGGLPGLVLVNRCEHWSLVPLGASAVVVAESGLGLAALAHALARQGWSGLEPACGIPGSVGAAVVTNAGAHGWEMADSLVRAAVLDASGEAREWLPEEMGFRYRGSALKGETGHLVLRVTLAAHRDARERIKDRMDTFTARRRASQPTTPSAGSMFKNPPGDYAGRLIEAAGLKGLRVGGAEVSRVHANFIVNDGGATAGDVEALLERVRQIVWSRFGVGLELEIQILGRRHAT